MNKNRIVLAGTGEHEFMVKDGVCEVMLHVPYYDGYFFDDDIGKEVEVLFRRYFSEYNELYPTKMRVVSIERLPTTQYIHLREISKKRLQQFKE